MEQLISDFSLGLFVWQTLLFVTLLFLLKKFAWKPILKAVNDREESIVSALDSAKEAEAKLEALKDDNAKLMKQAREERDVILKEAREAKDAIVAEAKGKASSEAERILADAKQEINNEKMKALTELKNEVAGLSIEIAEKILKQELSEEGKKKALVDNLVEEVNLN